MWWASYRRAVLSPFRVALRSLVLSEFTRSALDLEANTLFPRNIPTWQKGIFAPGPIPIIPRPLRLFSLNTKFALSFRIRQKRVRPATAKNVCHVDLRKSRHPSCSVANRHPLVVVRLRLADRLVVSEDVPGTTDMRRLRR